MENNLPKKPKNFSYNSHTKDFITLLNISKAFEFVLMHLLLTGYLMNEELNLEFISISLYLRKKKLKCVKAYFSSVYGTISQIMYITYFRR